jgi:hypothetical protein
VLETVAERRTHKNTECGNRSRPSIWLVAVSRVLTKLGIIREPLRPFRKLAAWRTGNTNLTENVPPEWANLCKFWFDTSTLCLNSRRRSYHTLLNIGRWVGHEHMEPSPVRWTRDLAAKCVAMVIRIRNGEWTKLSGSVRNRGNLPLRTPRPLLCPFLRRFFHDLQEWETIPRRFNPLQAFATPKTLIAQIGPKPRVIADDLWAKLHLIS